MDPDGTVRDLRDAIARLQPDPPAAHPGKWYRTQHEHWLGWLDAYAGPGAYGRTRPSPTSARAVYHRIVEPKMLLYLAEAAGVDAAAVARAREAVASATSMMQASGRVRRIVPWEVVAPLLPPPGRPRQPVP